MPVKILKVPESVLYPMILAFSAIGVYSLSRDVFDLYLVLAIGVLGFLLRRFKYPLAPVVLGIVLGPLLETQFRRALDTSRGNWLVFVESPLALAILVFALLMVFVPLIFRFLRRNSSAEIGGKDIQSA